MALCHYSGRWQRYRALTWIFGFTCWHFCYCYLMAPPPLRAEADSRGVFWTGALPCWGSCRTWYLCGGAPASSPPRFPGEAERASGQESCGLPPLPFLLLLLLLLLHNPPTITAPLIVFPFLFMLLGYPHTPRPPCSPHPSLHCHRTWPASLFSAKWVLFKE